ncbi:hypothetical protein IV203_031364 [Nitzschia inconspicua]|uniref:Uncharacterized protein n=1 Tax=Nitzschia inconspicua TaxID=303405 RepID=A0A9K3Q2J9_9STRA|nr:hypothetical protein IV203_031364 [Nitzschia inconspicua]
MPSSYDGSVAASRRLTDEESKELRLTIFPYFLAAGSDNNEMATEDISDFVEYALTMISNMKSVDYVIEELLGMEMDFFTPQVAEEIGDAMAKFIQALEGRGEGGEGNEKANKEDERGNIASQKTVEKRGNALTMSGALGASREGGRTKNNIDKSRGGETKDRRERNSRDKGRGPGDRGGRGGGRPHGNREGGRGGGRNHVDREGGKHGNRDGGRREDKGGRTILGDAFDRLSRGGRSQDRPDHRRENRVGREGPHGRAGGRGGRDFGRARGLPDHGDRISGNRRVRSDYEDEEFMAVDGGRAGGGRGGRGGRGRAGPEGPNKRTRHDEGHSDEAYHEEAGYRYDERHGHNGGGHSYPPPTAGGRGRGRGRDFAGRGRGHGGGGRSEHGEEKPNNGGAAGDDANANAVDLDDAANHPSPMVQASYFGGRGGYGYSYGGKGHLSGRGRGRGRTFPGRAHVVSMIQSKTWVRKKEDGSGENQSAGDAEG